MKNHMNSPKIKKAIELTKQYKEAWLADNKELESFRLAKPIDYGYEWVNEHQRRMHRNEVAFDLFKLEEAEAVKLVWAYYKGKLSNKEISAIVSNLF